MSQVNKYEGLKQYPCKARRHTYVTQVKKHWGVIVSPGREQLRMAVSHLENMCSATHIENTLGNSQVAVVGLCQQLIHRAAPRLQISLVKINMHEQVGVGGGGVFVKKRYKKDPFIQIKQSYVNFCPELKQNLKCSFCYIFEQLDYLLSSFFLIPVNFCTSLFFPKQPQHCYNGFALFLVHSKKKKKEVTNLEKKSIFYAFSKYSSPRSVML